MRYLASICLLGFLALVGYFSFVIGRHHDEQRARLAYGVHIYKVRASFGSRYGCWMGSRELVFENHEPKIKNSYVTSRICPEMLVREGVIPSREGWILDKDFPIT